VQDGGEGKMKVEVAATDAQIEACYPVMRELRPHLDAHVFVEIVREMQRDGYVLVFLKTSDRILGVAGFRTKRTLSCDKFLYVDDLVTVSTERSKGYGRILLEWLKDRARAEGCAQLHLDSGIQREDAHRFYERNGVPAAGYHFRVELEKRVPWSRS
jgi:GNAT superfamily N-acetyltransferase